MDIKDRLKNTKKRLDNYYEAEIAVLSSQEYKIGTKSLTRADLREIRKAIFNLERQVNELESVASGKGRRKSLRAVPRDL